MASQTCESDSSADIQLQILNVAATIAPAIPSGNDQILVIFKIASNRYLQSIINLGSFS